MPEPKIIAWEEANKYIGKEKIIEGTVAETYRSPKNNNVYLNLNSDYKTYGSVAIKNEGLGRFKQDPASYFKGKKVKVTGTIVQHKGSPRIWVSDPSQIEVLEPAK